MNQTNPLPQTQAQHVTSGSRTEEALHKTESLRVDGKKHFA